MKELTEREAEDFLEKQGFNVVKRALIKSKQELAKLEKQIKFPWAMKVSSKDINHKMKLGGVILNIKTQKEAESAFEKLSKIKDFEQAMVQEMLSGEELILGIKKTPEFNQVIMLGAGGSNVEQKKDVSFRVLPINKEDTKQMLEELKIYNQIKNKVHVELILQNLLKLSNFAEKNPNMQELDINPLMINKNQAEIVDARIVFE
jgi:succinyl-CoA synthetase beta subunit